MRFSSQIKAMAVGVLMLMLFGLIYLNDLSNQQEVVESQARSQLNSSKAELQRNINEILLLTDSLASLVHAHPEVTQESFTRITSFYEKTHPSTLSLQLAPNGIVEFVTDPQRNAAAIGHNLLEGANTRESAQLALETRSKISVGPVSLMQGGTAMITRQPIFLRGDTFWGFSTVLVDMDRFLSEHFDKSQQQSFAIRGVSESGEPDAVFFGNSDVFVDPIASSNLFFGNRSWQIAVSDSFVGSVPDNFVLMPVYWVLALFISAGAVWSVFLHQSRHESLKLLVDEKTLSLQETLDELYRQNSKRNQIYGMIAHELRTPVSAISMMAEGQNTEEWLENRETVSLQSKALLDTLDDMRLLINPELKREIREETFTLFGLSQQVERATHSLLSSCQFSYVGNLSGASVNSTFKTDLYRVRVAVTNLIRNACLHSGGNCIEVDWCIREAGSGVEELIVEVKDNGKGIAPENQQAIFALYNRGDTDAPGTGVGLHLAREWMQEIGGSLELVPTSSGALFRIQVPLKATTTHVSTNTEPYADSASLLASMRVLLVEDDPVLQLLGKKFFSMRAQQVDIAGSAQAAMNLFNKHSYELLITDHFLPDKNGDYVIREARAAGFKGIIIGHTAATLGSQMDALFDAGADAVLPKPLSSESLYACLKEITLSRASNTTPNLPNIRLII